jgi:hypothetical protein
LTASCFLNCSFEDCLLCYGGERCEWENTRFVSCRFLLDAPANNTVQALQGLGFQVVLLRWATLPCNKRNPEGLGAMTRGSQKGEDLGAGDRDRTGDIQLGKLLNT